MKRIIPSMGVLMVKSCAIFLLISFIVQSVAEEIPENSEQNERKLAIANNDLAFKLYKKLAAETSKNLFFSPFSISTALGMLFVGTGGETTKELRSVLGYDKANLSNAQVPSAFSNYLTDVIPSNNTAKASYILELSNALLLQKGMEFLSSYKEEVQNDFMALIKEDDFRTNAPKIKEEVNNFVKEKTHGKIDKILEDLDPSTVLLILNAIYFKGNWKTMFPKKDTKPQTFYNDGSNSAAKEVPFMHLKSKFPYTFDYNNNVQALELPYKGDNISMVILLPTERDGIDDLEKSLTQEKFASIQKQLFQTKVTISMPKFKIEYSKQLNSDFKALGARRIFTRAANFSNMTPSNNVEVSEIMHKAYVEVNEEGSEAAAVTSIGFRATAVVVQPREINFIADHPFLFATVDKLNNLILFLGRVNAF